MIHYAVSFFNTVNTLIPNCQFNKVLIMKVSDIKKLLTISSYMSVYVACFVYGCFLILGIWALVISGLHSFIYSLQK